MQEFRASRTLTYDGQTVRASAETLLLTCKSEVKESNGAMIAELAPVSSSFNSVWVPNEELNETLQSKQGGANFHVDFTFTVTRGHIRLLSLVHRGEEVICYPTEAAARNALTGTWRKRKWRKLKRLISHRVRAVLLRQAARLP